ncbi:MAG: CDGSH iron-sulfur domain-containing protein [Thermoplasmataceae archaeon]
MSRLVLHERNRPYVVKAGDEEIYLCGCGLSANKPYCDGTHKKTVDEKSGVFIYDNKGERVKIESFYQNP